MDSQAMFESFTVAMKGWWLQVAQFIPRFATALLIVVVGYLISRLVRSLGVAVLRRFGLDKLSEKVGIDKILSKAGTTSTASEIIGGVIFWFLILTFLVSTTETLGLEKLSETIRAMVLYLPKVVGAFLIAIVGLAAAHLARTLVQSGAESMGIVYAKTLSNLIYSLIAVVVVTLAVGQLGIEMELLSRMVQIVFLAVGVTMAIALGFGMRDTARNIVSGIYAREIHKPGSALALGERQGILEEVGTVVTRFRTQDGGVIYMPNRDLVDTIVEGKVQRS